MTPAPAQRGPDRGRLGPDALAFLASRNTLDADSADFAKNRHFLRLYGGPLDGRDKPVVLFTACPNDPLPPDLAMPSDLAEWAGPPARTSVDGQLVPLLGLSRMSASPLLVVEKSRRILFGGDALMYRELYANGFYECGSSALFLGPGGQGGTELRLCHMVGDFWAFLAHTVQVYARLKLDGPFTALLSIRNSGRLDLGNYGDEALDPSRGIVRSSLFGPSDPAASSANLQWRQPFGSAREADGEAVARAARDMAAYVCNAYSAGDPLCYDSAGRFSWKMWNYTRHEALKRGLP